MANRTCVGLLFLLGCGPSHSNDEVEALFPQAPDVTELGPSSLAPCETASPPPPEGSSTWPVRTCVDLDANGNCPASDQATILTEHRQLADAECDQPVTDVIPHCSYRWLIPKSEGSTIDPSCCYRSRYFSTCTDPGADE